MSNLFRNSVVFLPIRIPCPSIETKTDYGHLVRAVIPLDENRSEVSCPASISRDLEELDCGHVNANVAKTLLCLRPDHVRVDEDTNHFTRRNLAYQLGVSRRYRTEFF